MLPFAEIGNNRVRVVDPDGLLRTVLGTEEHGLSGEGEINLLTDVAVDSVGNVYVAAHSHEGPGTNHILMVGPDGSITTIAGTGAPGYSGDEGPATEAELNLPMASTWGPMATSTSPMAATT